MNIYCTTHRILLFQRIFVNLFPGLQSILPLIERLYRYVCLRVFDHCDRSHKLPCKGEAVVNIALIFHEIKKPTEIEISDPSVLSHLKRVLQSRLQVLCSRIPDFDTPKKVESSIGTPNAVVALMVSRIREFSSYVPPGYKVFISIMESFMDIFTPVHQLFKLRDLLACLLRRSNDGECCNNNVETDNCCCAWISDRFPSSLLKLLGCSVHSFADYVHSSSWKTRPKHADISFDPRQALNTMFKGIGKDSSSIGNEMVVFSGALYLGLRSLLVSMDYLTSKCNIIERIKLPEAVTLYHEFWDSETRGEVQGLTTTDEVFSKFCGWARKRPHFETIFETKELRSILFENLMPRL